MDSLKDVLKVKGRRRGTPAVTDAGTTPHTQRVLWFCSVAYYHACPLCGFQVSSPGARLTSIPVGSLSSHAKALLQRAERGETLPEITCPADAPPELRATLERVEAYHVDHQRAVHGTPC